MLSNIPRSSITVTDHGSARLLRPTALEMEVAREEKSFEAYGGDDPHEPRKDKNAPPPPEDNDPNIVAWDGPDDPTNPQNWSKRYKWFITVICCVMTVNV